MFLKLWFAPVTAITNQINFVIHMHISAEAGKTKKKHI